jgi:hypothetical protein
MAGWKIFIGSTAVDLPEYRRAAIEVCQELGLEPIFVGMMRTITSGRRPTIPGGLERPRTG